MRTVLAFLFLAALAEAGPIGIGPWYEFGFDPEPFPAASGCQPADPAGVPCRVGISSQFLDSAPWTFTAPNPVLLSVTDAYFAGDSFSVFDFGVLLGSTPRVPLMPALGSLDPNLTFADPAYSHASFMLPAGSHSLTIDVEAAQILGEGFFRISEVPEPSHTALLAVVLALFMRRACRNRT